MAQLILDGMIHIYNTTFDHGDPRVQNWPLMQSPMPTIGICLSYVYLVKYLGPSFMKDRKPYNIRFLMVFYNSLMVVISLFMFIKLGIYGWFGKYNLKCQPVDYSNSVEAVGMAHLSWWYYISKFLEFFDTIFFVLRKKFTHVSTLHVIHHGVMPMSVWWGVKFTPGGHSTFFAFVNSFVHIIMYIYYALSAVGPHMHRYLWWKKYMTTIQMVQFVFIFVHSFQLLFRDCNYPRGFMWWIGFHAVMFWFLFWDFYKSTYSGVLLRKSKSSSTTNSAGATTTAAATTTTTTRSSSSLSSVLSSLPSMCSLEYEQLSNGYQTNGTVSPDANSKTTNNHSNGVHKAHKNGIKFKDL